MKNPDVRWLQRFDNYKRALAQLQDAVDLAGRRELSALERQGLVQAFEFTHELAWKTLKDFLEERGQVEFYGSRDATREAFAAGLITDGDLWMAMIASRNQTSHTYNEETVEDITGAILRDYAPAFQALRERLGRLEEEVG
jgi:nucleotidyltransferase substrate binding protein (TIGR01987 family)